ncbi:MAG TPA: efflux RND transporter periplasmic adaptor subunit [Anaerolineales bacterium]|nr:efflux RND transporter periplasmic adaptor subunit [Anaerolineales bacterium]
MSKFVNSIKNLLGNLWRFLKKRRGISIPVGILLLIVVALTLMRGRARTQSSFQTQPLSRGDLTATIGATGTVRANQSAVLVWQTTGTVDQVNVKVGDQVNKGDMLASLLQTSLPQNVILAQADLVSAQQALSDLLDSDTARANAWIALRNAQTAYKTALDNRTALNGPVTYQAVTLVQIGSVTVPQLKTYRSEPDPTDIANADAQLALAKAQLEDAQRAYDRVQGGPNGDDLSAAQARVDAAQAALSVAHIIAPFGGTITQAQPMSGDQVAVGTQAFRLDDLSSMFVDVQVSEVDINNISVGQPATITFDAVQDKPDPYNGVVTEVSQAGVVTSGEVNFTVTVKLTDADSQVKPGMTAAVNIIVNQVKDQLLIPNQAVRLVNGNRVVYILVNDRPQQVEVNLGPSSDTMSVVSGGSLKVGDLIILNPPTQFQPGGGGGAVRIGGGG